MTGMREGCNRQRSRSGHCLEGSARCFCFVWLFGCLGFGGLWGSVLFGLFYFLFSFEEGFQEWRPDVEELGNDWE